LLEVGSEVISTISPTTGIVLNWQLPWYAKVRLSAGATVIALAWYLKNTPFIAFAPPLFLYSG